MKSPMKWAWLVLYLTTVGMLFSGANAQIIHTEADSGGEYSSSSASPTAIGVVGAGLNSISGSFDGSSNFDFISVLTPSVLDIVSFQLVTLNTSTATGSFQSSYYVPATSFLGLTGLVDTTHTINPALLAPDVTTSMGINTIFPNNSLSFDYSWLITAVLDPRFADNLFKSAIPVNQAIGQVAPSIHTTGTRDFSSRLFRARSRWVPADGVASTSFGPTRTVSASRFVNLKRELNVDTTINLGGVPDNVSASGSSLDTPLIDDNGGLFAITRQAGCSVDPNTLACGRDWVLFGSADFGQWELDNLGGNPTVESNTQAASLGLEYAINENLAVGVGWSHSWNETQFGNNAGGVDIEGDAGTVYASYFKNNLWSDLMYSYGSYEADITRYTDAGTTVIAAPDIQSHQTAFNVGYNIGHCGGDIVHGPTFGATYTNGTLDGYTETGDPLRNTTFAAQDYESLITTLGWQVNWKMETNYGIMRPQLRLGYGRENLDQDQTITAIVPQLNNTVFTQNQLQPGENWIDLGAGVSWQVKDNVSVMLDYNTQILRDDVSAHFGTVRARVGF